MTNQKSSGNGRTKNDIFFYCIIFPKKDPFEKEREKKEGAKKKKNLMHDIAKKKNLNKME